MASASRALLLPRALQAVAASRSVPSFLRPLAAAASLLSPGAAEAAVRCFVTQPATPSLLDSSQNGSRCPPKETMFDAGCDFEHWLVVMERPPVMKKLGKRYIRGQLVIISPFVPLYLKELPKVYWATPDSYVDEKNKVYRGKPFINGETVPYDPKYHEEWLRHRDSLNESACHCGGNSQLPWRRPRDSNDQ